LQDSQKGLQAAVRGCHPRGCREGSADLPAPEVLAREIVDELEKAAGEFTAIAEALDNQ